MTGIVDLSAHEYHADQIADVPTLSASVAKLFISQSPMHAWAKHPRLNPRFVPDDDDRFAIGTAAHALLLEGRNAVEICEYRDWKTNAAKDERQAAKDAGKLPMLGKDWDACMAMVEAARVQLHSHEAEPPLFANGKAEVTIAWDEPGGVKCRARLDWLRDDLAAIDDYKTSKISNPEQWTRSLFGLGYDVQASFYLRGLRAVKGVDAEFRFVVQEVQPPYALSVVSLGPDVMQIADKKVQYAVDTWRACLANDSWPGYPSRVCWADLPAWEETRWLLKEEREAVA